MSFAFLFSHKALSHAFRDGQISAINQQVLNCLGQLKEENDSYFLWATTQTKCKLKSWLNCDQYTRFDGIFKEEPTTRGVDSFDADNSTSESAKNLSLDNMAIVICEDEEFSSIYENSRILKITPKQFMFIFNKSDKDFEIFLTILRKKSYCKSIIEFSKNC